MITIPSGLYLKKKVIANEILYAGLTGGTTKIAKSIDSGSTWINENVILNGNPIIFCKDDLGNLYCGTDTGYIYKNWAQSYYIGNGSITGLDYINGIIYAAVSGMYYAMKFTSYPSGVFTLNFNGSINSVKFIDNYIFGPNGIWTLSGTQILAGVIISTAVDMGNGFIYFSTSNGYVYVNTTINDYTSWTFKTALAYNVIFAKKYGTKIIFLTTSGDPGNVIIYDTINNSVIIGGFGSNICTEKLNEKIIYGTNTGYIILSNNGLVNTQSMKLFNATSINAIIKI